MMLQNEQTKEIKVQYLKIVCYLRYCALLCGVVLYSISNINSTQINNAEYVDVVMPMHDLIEYSDNYSKESGVLWQYYRDEPNANTTESEPFKSKSKKIGKTPDADNNKKKCSDSSSIKVFK